MKHCEEWHWRSGKLHHGLDDASLRIWKNVALWIAIRVVR